MHSKALIFFEAMRTPNLQLIHEFLKSDDQRDQAPWLLNENNLPALDLALMLGHHEIINIFLELLAKKPDRFEFTYALTRVLRVHCSKLADLQDYFDFFKNPESIFPFLKEASNNWTSWAFIKPQVQQIIRSYTVCKMLFDFFDKQQPSNLYDTSVYLIDTLNHWAIHPIFSEHRNSFMYLMKSTSTVALFNRLKEACIFIAKKKESLLSSEMTPETAENILLLCSKCFPFTTGYLSASFKQLANDILSKFSGDPKAFVSLFNALADKQWFYTEDYTPIFKSTILSVIDADKIRLFLAFQGHSNAASQLRAKKTVELNIGPGMDVFALCSVGTVKKSLEISGPLDEANKKYLHLLLMNNVSVTLRLKNFQICLNEIYSLFSHSACLINIQIDEPSQLDHLTAHFAHYHHTQKNFSFTIDRKMLRESRKKILELIASRSLLGPSQHFICQVVNTHAEGRILADWNFQSSRFSAGPYIKSLLLEDLTTDRDLELSIFSELYNQLPWAHYPEAELTEQLKLLAEAALNNQPSMFCFNLTHYNPALFNQAKRFLFNTEKVLMICFEKNNRIVCDFTLSAQSLKQGPLCEIISCQDPSLFLSATETLVRSGSASSLFASSLASSAQELSIIQTSTPTASGPK